LLKDTDHKPRPSTGMASPITFSRALANQNHSQVLAKPSACRRNALSIAYLYCLILEVDPVTLFDLLQNDFRLMTFLSWKNLIGLCCSRRWH
jgi:hypothetical protein